MFCAACIILMVSTPHPTLGGGWQSFYANLSKNFHMCGNTEKPHHVCHPMARPGAPCARTHFLFGIRQALHVRRVQVVQELINASKCPPSHRGCCVGVIAPH